MTEQQLKDAAVLHMLEATACLSAIADWQSTVHAPEDAARYVAALQASAVVSQAKAKGIRAHLDWLRNAAEQE